MALSNARANDFTESDNISLPVSINVPTTNYGFSITRLQIMIKKSTCAFNLIAIATISK